LQYVGVFHVVLKLCVAPNCKILGIRKHAL